jgi:hypothetical protein
MSSLGSILGTGYIYEDRVRPSSVHLPYRTVLFQLSLLKLVRVQIPPVTEESQYRQR